MSALSNFNIHLENNKVSFKPGETIFGSVDFNLNHHSDIKSVKVAFSGVADVHWTAEVVVKNDQKKEGTASCASNTEAVKDSNGSSETKDSNKEYEKKTIVSYDSNEEWFYSQLVLLHNQVNTNLEAGRHSYSFEFVLPRIIPASLQHSIGKISYSIEAFIEKQSFTETTKRSFIVDHYLDLNSEPSLKLSYGDTAKKEFCCDIIQCKKEPVLANFSVQRSGYMPGQAIIFNVIINNKSSRAINFIHVNLYKNLIFKTPKQTKTIKLEVASTNLRQVVAPRTVERWENQVLDIPSNLKATSNISRIIETNYIVVLRFGAGGFTTVMDCAIPIVIGTEPFEGEGYVTASNGSEILSENPPSYEEALLQYPSAPPEEDSWLDKLSLYWK